MTPESKPIVRVRPAREDDVESINDIYNHYVLSSCCTYQTEPSTLEERLYWFDNHQAIYPVIVAEVSGLVVGWASISPFHERQAYRQTVETSIYVHHACHGQGVGSILMQELLQISKRLEYHVLMSLIDSSQEASLALHEKFGFVRCGHLSQVGFKFGKYLDVVYMQKTFDPILKPQ